MKKKEPLNVDNFDKKVVDRYNQIVKKLLLRDPRLMFLYTQIYNPPINSYLGINYTAICLIPEVGDILEKYGFNGQNDIFLRDDVVKKKCKDEPLVIDYLLHRCQKYSFLDEVFSYKKNRISHYREYALYLYFKLTLLEYIETHYKSLDIITDLTKNQEEKSKMFYTRYKELVKVIIDERSSYEHAVCATNNTGLTRLKKKIYKPGINEFYSAQISLFETTALGMSEDEIKNGNYEKAKRLIYTPYKYFDN